MTDELVECFNCGRANPEWAQVCRSCGVPLQRSEMMATPAGAIPRDRDSLLSIAAVLAAILVAVLVGLFASSLNPIDGTVGLQPLATPTSTPDPTPEPTETPPPIATAAPTGSPGPDLPGSVTFGTELNADEQIVEPVDTFSPGMNFAHSVTVEGGFGVSAIGEQVVRILEDGTEEEVVSHTGDNPNVLAVNPEATTAGFSAGDAAGFVVEWGPGTYELRVYAAETLIAQGRFTLVNE